MYLVSITHRSVFIPKTDTPNYLPLILGESIFCILLIILALMPQLKKHRITIAQHLKLSLSDNSRSGEDYHIQVILIILASFSTLLIFPHVYNNKLYHSISNQYGDCQYSLVKPIDDINTQYFRSILLFFCGFTILIAIIHHVIYLYLNNLIQLESTSIDSNLIIWGLLFLFSVILVILMVRNINTFDFLLLFFVLMQISCWTLAIKVIELENRMSILILIGIILSLFLVNKIMITGAKTKKIIFLIYLLNISEILLIMCLCGKILNPISQPIGYFVKSTNILTRHISLSIIILFTLFSFWKLMNPYVFTASQESTEIVDQITLIISERYIISSMFLIYLLLTFGLLIYGMCSILFQKELEELNSKVVILFGISKIIFSLYLIKVRPNHGVMTKYLFQEHLIINNNEQI